ncbi:hypothetical protein [Aquibium oceanicum]|uniref:hypothetical protein n=1 Tax=Aquibium oceanicum TaxID=1670800 RepID=UPI000AA4000E|nr:hypothetical protein [Aquibium oceanicum]
MTDKTDRICAELAALLEKVGPDYEDDQEAALAILECATQMAHFYAGDAAAREVVENELWSAEELIIDPASRH